MVRAPAVHAGYAGSTPALRSKEKRLKEMTYDSSAVLASKVIEGVRTQYGKGARDLWKQKYCHKHVSGSGNYLFSMLKPTSEEDFYNKFVTYASMNKQKQIAWRGLDEGELMTLAESFKRDFEANAPCDNNVETYYNYLLLHLIQEPFNGHKKEFEFLDYLKRKGKDAVLADGELDLRYKVDIVVRPNIGIQVKRESILYSHSENVMKAMDDIKVCKDEVKNRYGLDMYYAIYTKDGTWLKNQNNGTVLFTYDEFIQLRK